MTEHLTDPGTAQRADAILATLLQHVGQGASPVSFLIETETVIELDPDNPSITRSQKKVALWTCTNQGAAKVIVEPEAAKRLAEELTKYAFLASSGLIGVSERG